MGLTRYQQGKASLRRFRARGPNVVEGGQTRDMQWCQGLDSPVSATRFYAVIDYANRPLDGGPVDEGDHDMPWLRRELQVYGRFVKVKVTVR